MLTKTKIQPHTDIIKSNLYKLNRLTRISGTLNARIAKGTIEYILIQLRTIEAIVREKNKEIFKLNEEIAELIRKKSTADFKWRRRYYDGRL